MKQAIQILKSQNDKLNYKFLQLPNKLKCILIQDTKTEQSSAVMNVAVGSMQNPKDVPGLAHFLEHMLFMGKSLRLENIGFACQCLYTMNKSFKRI